MAEIAHALAEIHEQRAAAAPERSRPAPHPLLNLQRLAGNAAVSALVAQRDDDNLANQSGGGGGGGGGGMLNLVSMAKSGTINVTLQNGALKDASATIG